MSRIPHVLRAGAFSGLLLLGSTGSVGLRADPPAVLDSQSIVRSLKPAPVTRGLVVAARPPGGGTASGVVSEQHKVNLDIRFASDSDRLTESAHSQLEQLGTALNSPELARARFLIAGHTSASGSAAHNLRLSQARARAVRAYLLEHFRLAPERIEATGYGSARPLPDFPPNALQQRRVEISALP
ncbi:MAG: OmpA family protein [Gammaproteobacteria bacterium]|nr:OmpA family protein [Gammaproteobacteria bacterium]